MTLERALFDFLSVRAKLPLYRGPLPENAPDTCAGLIYRGGQAEVDGRVAQAAFQLLVRGESQDHVLAIYQQVRDLLLRYYQQPLGDSGYVLYSVTENSSGFLGQDERGRYVMSANFTVRANTLS